MASKYTVAATQHLPSGHLLVYLANVESQEPVTILNSQPEQIKAHIEAAVKAGDSTDPGEVAETVLAMQSYCAALMNQRADLEQQIVDLEQQIDERHAALAALA